MMLSAAIPPQIVVNGLDVRFPNSEMSKDKNIIILKNINLSIQSGEFVSLLGPSGCGKTTLLRAIAGLITPSAGSIMVDGQIVTTPSPDRTLIFQDYGLFDWKTVRENVEFGLKALGVSPAIRREKADKYINMVNMKSSENKYPVELSGGMKQRAAIARALVVEPACLLMDEPFAALDALGREGLQEEIVGISQKTYITILLVTHNIEEAVFLSDRIFVLAGTPAALRSEIKVALARPRRADVRLTPQFRAIVEEVGRELRLATSPHFKR